MHAKEPVQNREAARANAQHATVQAEYDSNKDSLQSSAPARPVTDKVTLSPTHAMHVVVRAASKKRKNSKSKSLQVLIPDAAFA